MAQIPIGKPRQTMTGRYVRSTSTGKYIELGQQPAKIQYRPIARPSNATPPPPPPAAKTK